jgi:hypothetical protein
MVIKWILLIILILPWSVKAITPEKIPGILFYIERNLNSNRVVYEANFDEDGKLHSKHPINTHWIMNEKNGESESLNYVEKKMAYGVECTLEKNSKVKYHVKLVADETRKFILKQIAPFDAEITTVIKGVTVKLTRLFIDADNSSYWPKVKYVLIEGLDMKTQHLISEEIHPEE